MSKLRLKALGSIKGLSLISVLFCWFNADIFGAPDIYESIHAQGFKGFH